jgi:hypothetical protein
MAVETSGSLPPFCSAAGGAGSSCMLPGALHRVSAIRAASGQVVGLTFKVGRWVADPVRGAQVKYVVPFWQDTCAASGLQRCCIVCHCARFEWQRADPVVFTA